MYLYSHGREFYKLAITAETSTGDPVPAGAWEASFDNGDTWVPAQVVDWNATSWSAWLLAGPNADPADAIVISRSVLPQLRLIDSPEIVVRSAGSRVTLKG